MTVPDNWWSCNHPPEAIVLLEDKNTEWSFYACNNCGLVEGEHDLTEEAVTEALRDRHLP